MFWFSRIVLAYTCCPSIKINNVPLNLEKYPSLYKNFLSVYPKVKLGECIKIRLMVWFGEGWSWRGTGRRGMSWHTTLGMQYG